ncbi:phosphate metabolism protein 7 [Coemansia sp. RSA 2320]|nr:phosphate metabolism protein 7 [Coemansia sp. RSA 2320]
MYESTAFSWVAATYKVDSDEVFRVAGPDAAMFMRSLRSNTLVFLVYGAVALPVLLAVDVDSNGQAMSLERLTMSNIENIDGRVWAHIVMFALFPVVALYATLADIRYYIDIRKRYLQDPDYQQQLRANTVIMTGVPSSENVEEYLESKFGSFYGGVLKAIPCLSCPAARRLVEQRKWHVRTLESDVCRYLLKAHRRRKQGGWRSINRPFVHTNTPACLYYFSHFKLMGGDRVDAIEYHCRQIVQLNNEICMLRACKASVTEPSISAIVVFNSQQAAHEAVRPTNAAKWHKRATATAYWPRFNDIDPTEVNWNGVNVGARLRRLCEFVSRIFIFTIITLWIFPVVFISALSKLTQLSQLAPFKAISDWPTPLAGFVEGVFPPLILSFIQWGVPLVFRGQPTEWHKELALMNYVLCFQVVDAFIIPVAATTVFSSLGTFIHDPVAAATKIVAEIPTVSTFFMAYVLMRALTNSAMEIARVVHVLYFKCKKTFSGRTPRIYSRLNSPSMFQYAEQVPVHALVFLLGAMYSPMAPLMTIAAALYFALFSFAYAYKFMNVYDDASFRLGGRIATKLLQQRWISLYVSQVVFCGAFAIRTSTRKTAESILQLVVACMVLVATFAMHMTIKSLIYPQLLYPMLDDVEQTASAQSSPDLCLADVVDQTGEATLPACAHVLRENQSIQEMAPGVQPQQTAADTTGGQHAEKAPPAERLNMEQILSEAAPLAYEPWRVDPRPETSRIGPGARLLKDVVDNTPLLWQEEMTDPGYALVWLPTISINDDFELAAASISKIGFTEETSDDFNTDLRTFAEMLYAEIDQRLGSYGCVVTMHAVLDEKGIHVTTPTRPENWVHRVLRRA